MSHYFEDIERKEEDYFFFDGFVAGLKLKFKSANNIFSKDKIDYGTKTLIESIYIKHSALSGDVLDLGCGLGVIGISLKKLYPNINLFMSDITKSAVRLTKANLKLNEVEAKVVNSNIYDNIDKSFDFINTNPPIKNEKQIIVKMIEEALKKHNENGELLLVIKKQHGKDSIKKLMEQTFGNCEVLQRDKGYYILNSKKYGD